MQFEHIPGPTLRRLGELCAGYRALEGVKRIFLYGSFANNTSRPDSDMDIAIFIDEELISLREAFRAVTHMSIDGQLDVQPQVFSLAELDSPIGIVEEIVEHGVEIPVSGIGLK